MSDRFAVLLLRYRVWFVLGALGLVTLLASPLVPPDRIRFDFSFRRLFRFDGEDAARLTRFKNRFGDDAGNVGLLYLAAPGEGPRPRALAPDVLRSMARVQAWLAPREELEQDELLSPLTATDFFAEPVRSDALADLLPDRADAPWREWGRDWRSGAPLPAELADLEAGIIRLRRHEVYRGQLFSENGDAAALLFRFNLAHNHPSSRRDFLAGLEALVEDEQQSLGETVDIETFGIPVVTEEYTRLSVQDIIRTAPLSMLVMTLFLFLLFRSATAVILPQLVVQLAVLSAVGFMQWTDEPLNIISHIVPVIVLVVGVADAVHILSRYSEERHFGADPPTAVRRTVAMLSKACFLTSTTTAVGFASLMTATIATIASFGFYTALAVMFTFAVNMTLLPIGLATFKARPREPSRASRLMRFLEGTAAFSVRYARPIFVVGVVLSLAGVVYVVSGLQVNSHLLEEVPPENRVYRATKAVEQRLTPVIPHEVLVEGRVYEDVPCTTQADCRARTELPEPENLVCVPGAKTARALEPIRDGFAALVEPVELELVERLGNAIDGALPPRRGVCVEAVTDPGLLAALDRVERDLRKDPTVVRHVGRYESLGALVKQMHQAIRRDAPGSFSIHESRAAVAQLLLPIESANQELLNRYTTLDNDASRFSLHLLDHGSSAWQEVRLALEAAFARHIDSDPKLEGRFDLTITGTMTFVDKALSFIVHDMLLSVSTAFFFIFLLMVLLFRSLRIGLLSILPNVFPLVTTLTLMTAADIELRTATIIIFSISLGIAVNDTIHFIARYNEELGKGADRRTAVFAAMRSAGKAMITTTLILAGGFLVDLVSEFVALRQFGYLASFTLLMALIGDLLILPACLMLFDRKRGEEAA
jgi:predicted RND superfamily exporter protein